MKLTNFARRTIETWRLGFVATVGPGSLPNLSPKGTFVVVDDASIAFAEMRSPVTVANIRINPEVEINFVDILIRRGIRIRGRAEIHEKDSESYTELEPLFMEHWPEFQALFNLAVRVPIREIRLLTSPIYEVGGVEAELRNHWKNRIAAL